jgi:hypothetical protein
MNPPSRHSLSELSPYTNDKTRATIPQRIRQILTFGYPVFSRSNDVDTIRLRARSVDHLSLYSSSIESCTALLNTQSTSYHKESTELNAMPSAVVSANFDVVTHTAQQTLIFNEMLNVRMKLEEENQTLRDQLDAALIQLQLINRKYLNIDHCSSGNQILEHQSCDSESQQLLHQYKPAQSIDSTVKAGRPSRYYRAMDQVIQRDIDPEAPNQPQKVGHRRNITSKSVKNKAFKVNVPLGGKMFHASSSPGPRQQQNMVSSALVPQPMKTDMISSRKFIHRLLETTALSSVSDEEWIVFGEHKHENTGSVCLPLTVAPETKDNGITQEPCSSSSKRCMLLSRTQRKKTLNTSQQVGSTQRALPSSRTQSIKNVEQTTPSSCVVYTPPVAHSDDAVQSTTLSSDGSTYFDEIETALSALAEF